MINFDCHAHVYERVGAIRGARYVPPAPAPLSNWLHHQDQHGLKGGVIVQVSFLGTDNSELCAALGKLGRTRFAGVAVVLMDVSEGELEHLSKAGVRGLRWNLVRGAELPDLKTKQVQQFFGKLRQAGLHLEIHLEGPRLAPVLEVLTDQGMDIVIDHFGLPSDPNPKHDPLVRAVAQLDDTSALYFKFSAHYRTPFDVRPHAQALLAELSEDRVIWGSDWPHTQHEQNTDFASVCIRRNEWGIRADYSAAKILYGIGI